MRVREWMTPDPMTVSPQTSVAQARGLMHSHGVRHLPVVDGGRLVGMISDRDVGIAPPGGTDAMDAREVADVMSSPPHVVETDDTVHAAASLMLSRRVSGLPVVSDGALVGIVTTTDCLLALLTPHSELRDT